MTILEPGTFWIGVTRRSTDHLERHLGERPSSWGLFSGAGAAAPYKAGDVLSVSYDLSGIRAVLLFSLNGVRMDCNADGIKGDVYPGQLFLSSHSRTLVARTGAANMRPLSAARCSPLLAPHFSRFSCRQYACVSVSQL